MNGALLKTTGKPGSKKKESLAQEVEGMTQDFCTVLCDEKINVSFSIKTLVRSLKD